MMKCPWKVDDIIEQLDDGGCYKTGTRFRVVKVFERSCALLRIDNRKQYQSVDFGCYKLVWRDSGMWEIGDVIEQIGMLGGGNTGDQFVIVTKEKRSDGEHNYMAERLEDRKRLGTNDLCAKNYKFLRNDLTMLVVEEGTIEAEIVNNNSTEKDNNMKLVFVNPDFKITKFKFNDWVKLTDIEFRINNGLDIKYLGAETVTDELSIGSNDKTAVIKMLREHVFKNMGLAEAKAYVEQQCGLGFTEFEVRNWR